MITLVLAGALASAPFDVVRAGDSQMSCEALIGEINALTTETTAHQQQASAGLARAGMPVGAATAHTAIGMLSSMLPFGGGMVQAAAADAQMAAARSRIKSATDAMTADIPKLNRIERLTEIVDKKDC